MCTGPCDPSEVPEPTVLALAPSLEQLADCLNSLVKQLDRLYEQRHFELQQKYGQESFLNFQRKTPPLST